MTDCIYPGAYVSIPAYGAFAPADIYRAGDSLIIRLREEAVWSYKAKRPVTHILNLPERESLHFWRPDIGIAVVPLDACPRTANARSVISDGIDPSLCDGVTDE